MAADQAVNERDRRLAFAWHCVDAAVCLIGLGWSLYHLVRRPRFVETNPR